MQRSQVQREFSPQQITTLLQALGTDYRGNPDATDPLIFRTVCHHHDSSGSYKLYYYPETHKFHCYTHCGDTFDVYELVMRARGCTFFEALLFIEQTLNLSTRFEKVGFFQSKENEEMALLDRYYRIRSKREKAETQEPIPLLPPMLIDLYSKTYPNEWLQDHISPEAMDRFNIRFDISENEIVIPHYDMNGGLVGLRSRSFNQRKLDSGGKYMPTMLEGHDFRHVLRYHLYGLDKVKNAVLNSHKIALFEAEKSALQSYSYYGDKSFAVAVCGSNISTQQRDLILSLGVHEVFLGFDKEYHEPYSDESDSYAEKILHLASMFTPYCTTYVLWDTEGLLGYKDSPTDRGKEILEHLMKNKFEVQTERD